MKKLFENRGVRFLFVGVLNTIFGYAMFALFVFIDIPYLIANVFSTILGVIHSYFWNKYFTFQTKKKSVSEIIRFSTVYAVGFFLGTGTLYVMVDLCHLSEYVAGFINLFITTMISWFGHNYFSFKQNK